MGRVISISKLAQHYIFTLDLRDCMCFSVELSPTTGCQKKNGPPFNTKYGLFSIISRKSYAKNHAGQVKMGQMNHLKLSKVVFLHNFCVK